MKMVTVIVLIRIIYGLKTDIYFFTYIILLIHYRKRDVIGFYS
jgi:hypothetical protein